MTTQEAIRLSNDDAELFWSPTGSVVEVRADKEELGDNVVTFSLSSEEPYRRYDGDEILVHSAAAVDLSFLNSGNAPLLDNHNTYDGVRTILGVIEKAWLSKKRVYVQCRFSKRADAQDVLADLKDGIIKNVSVGYRRLKIERSEDEDTYRVTKWMPKEASLVLVPADPTVGIGRAATTTSTERATIMSGTPVMPSVEPEMTDEQRGAAMETAINEVTELAASHNIADLGRAFISQAIAAGETPRIEVFRGIARANIPEDKPLKNEEIGLGDEERRQFSIVNLARSMRDGASSADLEAAAFEREACDAAASSQTGAQRGQFVLPPDLMTHWGDFTVGGVNSRSVTVDTVRAALATSGTGAIQNVDHLADRFIENLRNRLVLGNLGATMLPGLDGNVEIPGADANISAAWLASEDADAAESNPSFRTVTLSIKDLAAYTDLTRRMLIQSTIAIEQYVRNQLTRAMAEAIDLAGFYGAGSGGVPEGIANVTGIGSVTFAAAIPTREEIIDLKTAIADTNRGTDIAYVANSTMTGDFQKTKVDPGSGTFLMQNEADRLIGKRYEETNQITDGDLFAGHFPDMLMGLWGSLELDRSTEAKFLSGGLRLRAIQSVDFGYQRVGSFALGNDGV